MQLQILLLCFWFTCLNGEANNSNIRHKRAILDLAGIIECGTGRSALTYLGYGCYCGIGGRGAPKDQADWCCHQHDCCYGAAENAGCHPRSEVYGWTCVLDKYIKCDYQMGKCQKILCNCDKELGRCLRRAPYNQKYAVFPNFLCQKKNPPCNYRGYREKSRREKYEFFRLDE